MQQLGKRIKVSGYEIQISSPKNIFMLILLPIWLIGWTNRDFYLSLPNTGFQVT